MTEVRIGAIETQYKGYRFRSRLEARWAVFFDALNMSWQYESEGYERRDEDGTVYRYLPDFYLPATQTYVEVKGDVAAFGAQINTFIDQHDYGRSPLPQFTGSWGTLHGILFLSQIPDDTARIVLHPMVVHQSGLWAQDCCFASRWLSRPSEPIVLRRWEEVHQERLPQWWGMDGLEKGWSCAPRYMVADTLIEWTQPARVRAAYTAARQARFEHGEQPWRTHGSAD